MSGPQDPRRTEDEDAKKAAPQADDKEAKSEARDAKSKYVFKIVPSNPKNTLDFEDVADK